MGWPLVWALELVGRELEGPELPPAPALQVQRQQRQRRHAEEADQRHDGV